MNVAWIKSIESLVNKCWKVCSDFKAVGSIGMRNLISRLGELRLKQIIEQRPKYNPTFSIIMNMDRCVVSDTPHHCNLQIRPIHITHVLSAVHMSHD